MSKLKQKRFVYSTDETSKAIYVNFLHNSVWLTKAQLANLLCVKQDLIVEEIVKINQYELFQEDIVSRKFLTPNYKYVYESTNKVKNTYYNVDMILAVGYRIDPNITKQFRDWVKEELTGKWRHKNLYAYLTQIFVTLIIIILLFHMSTKYSSEFFTMLFSLGLATTAQLAFLIVEAVRYYNRSF